MLFQFQFHREEYFHDNPKLPTFRLKPHRVLRLQHFGRAHLGRVLMSALKISAHIFIYTGRVPVSWANRAVFPPCAGVVGQLRLGRL